MEVNVTLVHRHRLVAEAFAKALEGLSGFRVLRIHNTFEEIDPRNTPDYIVVEADLLIETAYRPLANLRSLFPRTKIVVLGGVRNPKALITKGCYGCIDLNQSLDTTLKFFNGLVNGGGRILCTEDQSPPNPLDTLSERERAVLRCLCDGLKNKEIAERLAVAPQTVTSYITRICEKLGVTRKEESVFLALRFEIERNIHA